LLRHRRECAERGGNARGQEQRCGEAQ
jgi:hypothetical protein